MQPDTRVVLGVKKDTNTHRRADAVGCRCHRSACTKTRPDSRVLHRRKTLDENPPPISRFRMSLSSFRVQQDATGHQSIASTEKVTNTHRGVATVECRCHRSACTKMRTGQQSSSSTEKR
ncbi:hypothetical protein TNCV_1573671 [Trichonephila clavipes]|nr:hypothetical protein TNCV_1573671 [Trichonephila clavipes]